MTRYYCPKRWYRNTAGQMPVEATTPVAIVLNSHTEPQPPYSTRPAGNWRWTFWDIAEYNGSDIKYFRVHKRTPQLLENPSVQLHEMFPQRRG